MTNYKFQTIVATPEVRAEFSVMRDVMKSTDKELMTAMFELARKHPGDLEQIVKDQQDIARGYKERDKAIKAAAKVRVKEMVKEMLKKEQEEGASPSPEAKVKKARKPKAAKKELEGGE